MSFEEEFEALLKGNRIDFDAIPVDIAIFRQLRRLNSVLANNPRLGYASPGAKTLSTCYRRLVGRSLWLLETTAKP